MKPWLNYKHWLDIDTTKTFHEIPSTTSTAGEESTCNAGNPGSIPRLGSSPGEGMVYPLQDSWTSLVAQTVKNPPAMRENWVQSLGWEDPLEEGMAPHYSIFAWRIPTDREAWRAAVHGVAKSTIFGWIYTQFSSVQFSCSVVSDSLRPHELQHARPPCPSPIP